MEEVPENELDEGKDPVLAMLRHILDAVTNLSRAARDLQDSFEGLNHSMHRLGNRIDFGGDLSCDLNRTRDDILDATGSDERWREYLRVRLPRL